MTKKDYELIAKAVNVLTKSAQAISVDERVDVKFLDFLINQFINKLARSLSEDNPRFDWDKFIEACNKQ